MIDYKALRGDPSDNIKGVKGIGEKGATDLIKEFGSIDALYKAIHAGKGLENIKPRTLQLLVDQEDSARQSYHLATIVTNVPIDIEIPPYSFGAAESATAVEVFKQFEFKSLVQNITKN
jgi:DNA polymerase-1